MSGIDWKWMDDNGNEYVIEICGDMEIDLTERQVVARGWGKGRKYVAKVYMELPFDWVIK